MSTYSVAGILHILSHFVFKTTLISSIVHLGNLRAREIKELAQDHSVSKWKYQDLYPRQSHGYPRALHHSALQDWAQIPPLSGNHPWSPSVIWSLHLWHLYDIYLLLYVVVIFVHSPSCPHTTSHIHHNINNSGRKWLYLLSSYPLYC